MTDPNDTPNDTPNAVTSTPEPTAPTTSYPDLVIGLGSVTAQAVAGELSAAPQSDAAPAADQPATAPEPTGQAPDAAATIPTDTPGATDAAAPPATPVPAEGVSLAMREVRSNLNAIEQLAVFWGGETGTKIRNHVGRIRELLQ